MPLRRPSAKAPDPSPLTKAAPRANRGAAFRFGPEPEASSYNDPSTCNDAATIRSPASSANRLEKAVRRGS